MNDEDVYDEEESRAPDLLEHFFSCPQCGAAISMLLDTSVPSQSFVEDCEICCNGVEVTYRLEGDVLVEFRASGGD